MKTIPAVVLTCCAVLVAGPALAKDPRPELERRRRALEPDDARGALALARWCRDHDLFDAELTVLREAAARLPDATVVRIALDAAAQEAVRHRDPADPWRRRTERFDVQTTTSEAKLALYARAIAAFYERFAAFVRVETPPEVAWGAPIGVKVFRSRAQFDAYRTREKGADAESAVGYYSLRHKELVLYDDPNEPGKALTTLFHEGTHLLVHLALGKGYRRVPLWLHEGLAEYFGGARYDRFVEEFTLGTPRWERLGRCRELARAGTFPALADLFGGALEGHDTYAVAWALVHMLIEARNHMHRRAFGRFFAQVAETGDVSSFEGLFGKQRDVEARLRRHVQALEVPAVIEGRRLLFGGDPGGALKLLERACREAPDDPEGHYLRGEALARREAFAQAEAAFARANALRADYPAALAGQAVAIIRQQERYLEAAALFERAADVVPSATNTFGLALALQKGGALERARAVLRLAIERGAKGTGVDTLKERLGVQ